MIKSNVAIASATASYGRIEMINYKTLPDIKIFYTDTDSIITDRDLPNNLVGTNIGQMKDELNGGVIKEGYFLGIKKYAFIDNQNKTVTVFSGIPRNSLCWEDIINISKGNTILKKVPDQFLKYLNKLEIQIKPKNIEIKFNPEKKLIENKFQPNYINDISSFNFNFHLKKLLHKIKINKYILY